MRAYLSVAALALAACGAPASLPPSAEIRGGELHTVKLAYPSQATGDVLGRVERCAVLELGAPDAALADAYAGPQIIPGMAAAREVVPGRDGITRGNGFLAADAGGEYDVAGGMTRRVVRFKMLIEPASGELRFTAARIEHAQTSTGYAPNTGFFSVHTGTGGGAEKVYHVIEDQARAVAECVG